MFLTVSDLVGRLHPALVHLPIGILLISALLVWLSGNPRYQELRRAATICLFWGMITAILSCISGWFLSRSGEYDETAVNTHLVAALVTAVFSIAFYLLYKRDGYRFVRGGAVLLVLLIGATGHLGGSLTHGSDYIGAAFEGNTQKQVVFPPPQLLPESVVYTDLITPVLEARCYSCHGKSKQKGGLRLDIPERIMEGGKEGEVIEPGKAEASALIRRIMLSREDDDHMPPKEKPQLTDREIRLLHWWVESGAAFDKKMKETSGNETMLSMLSTPEEPEDAILGAIPSEKVRAADYRHIEHLKSKGVLVLPVASNSNYLYVNFTRPMPGIDTIIPLLAPLKDQLIWFKAADQPMTDTSMKIVAQLNRITRLDIRNTKITDAGLAQLKPLRKLQYLNLVGTNISVAGLEVINGMKDLRTLYLYKTNVKPAEIAQVNKYNANVQIDSGGYSLPLLAGDTSMVEYKSKKN